MPQRAAGAVTTGFWDPPRLALRKNGANHKIQHATTSAKAICNGVIRYMISTKAFGSS